MFTVILLSDWARERLKQWRELFQPFEESGALVFCDWNQRGSARTLAMAVPELADAIKGKSDWRLLVVGTGTEGMLGSQEADAENPFDYVDNWLPEVETGRSKELLNLTESIHPLVRLSHMVLGYPEMGAASFTADPSYWDPNTRERVYQSDFVAAQTQSGVREEEAVARFRAILPTKNDVQTHYKEVPHSPEELALYDKLSRFYEIRQVRPQEVLFVAVREPLEAKPRDVLAAAWETTNQFTPSQFASRNDYHPSCRFSIYDLQGQDHAAFELGELQLWLSCLTIAINDLPASSLHSERLYRLSVTVDPELLAGTLNQHLGLLTAAREHLKAELTRPRGHVRLEMDEILAVKSVPVSFENLQAEDLFISAANIRFPSDRPTSERARYEQEFGQLEKKAENFTRKPRRVLAKAVEDTKRLADLGNDFTTGLTEIEQDELRDELAKRTKRLAVPATHNILDRDRLERLVRESRTRVRNAIRERMTFQAIMIVSAIVLGVWFVTFIPYLISAYFVGGWALPESLLVVLIALGFVLLGIFVILTIMRQRFVRILNEVNTALRGYVDGVKAGATAFGSFLADLRTYIHGQEILDAQVRKAAEDKAQARQFDADLRRIGQIIDSEKSLIRALGQRIEIRTNTESNLQFQRWTSKTVVNLLQLPVSHKRCSYNNSGDTIKAPYDFVRRLSLQDLSLREKHVTASPANEQGSSHD